MRRLLPVLALAICMFGNSSCGQKEEVNDTPLAPGMTRLDLSTYGKPFSIVIPDSTSGKLEITEQSWGALEIKAGKNFQISIIDNKEDIELKKSDIKADEVNRFKQFIIEEANTILWESQITKPEFHFMSIQTLGNSTYTFEDIHATDNEAFSKEAIQRMLESARTIKEIPKADA